MYAQIDGRKIDRWTVKVALIVYNVHAIGVGKLF